MRVSGVSFLGGLVLALGLTSGTVDAAPLPAGLLPPATATGAALPALDGCRGLVLGFLGAECPVARQYAERLGDIADRYADRGVVVLGIDANRQDTDEEIAALGRDLGLRYPLLRDAGQKIARHVGATRTGTMQLATG